jgi:hypothetical protein
LATLSRAGRSVQQGGEAVSDPIQARVVLRQMVSQMVDYRMPVLARLGIIAR